MVVFEPHKSKPISDFHAELMFEFPNLPTQLFDYYILRTARIMAKNGHLFRCRSRIMTQPNVTRYRLVAPACTEIEDIISAYRHDCCGDERVTRCFTPPVGSCLCDRSKIWYDDEESTLHIEGNREGIYYLDVSLMPATDACELPEILYEKYFDTLMLGTKAAILLIAGRPWSNIRNGTAFRVEFYNKLAEDTVDASRHKMLGSVKMNFGRVL